MATATIELRNALDQVVSQFSESDIVAGDCKIKITIDGDTWIAAGGSTFTESAAALLIQNFQAATTGYDDTYGNGGLTWTEAAGANGGVCEAADTTSPLRGTQSLRLVTGSGGETSNTYSALGGFTDQSDVWVFFRLKLTDFIPASPNSIELVRLMDEGGNPAANMTLRATGVLRFTHGTVNMSADFDPGGLETSGDGVTYYVWLHYVRNTGGPNGVASFYVGTTTTRPADPVGSTAVGDGTYYVNSILFTVSDNASFEMFIDQVYISSSEIIDVPS